MGDLLYSVNTASQTIAAGDTVNFGNPVRRKGCAIQLSGNNVVVEGRSFYDIFANLTIQATGANTIIVSLLKDGVEIPGARVTITTAAEGIYGVAIPCEIRQKCCCDSDISCLISGASVTITNASILVKAS